MLAFGTIVSLLGRDEHGGQRVTTSLAAVITMIQARHLVRFAGRPTPLEGGRDFAGPSLLDRIHAVADGWVRVRAGGSAKDLVVALTGHADRDAEPSAAVADAFASLTRDEAVERLARAGIAAVPVRHLREVAADGDLVRQGLFRPYPHPDLARWITTGEHVTFSRTPAPPTAAAPRLGEHTVVVCRDAGLPDAAIDALLTRGVAAQAPPLARPAVME
jgi:crotonobetainyl-CoA:carnitine CoA-transferase CaiB-like acyl-CoA transferase